VFGEFASGKIRGQKLKDRYSETLKLWFIENNEDETIAVAGSLQNKYFIQFYNDNHEIEFEFYCDTYEEAKLMVEKIYTLSHQYNGDVAE
jgi:hypothetical protein